jgi:hypothetical protein
MSIERETAEAKAIEHLAERVAWLGTFTLPHVGVTTLDDLIYNVRTASYRAQRFADELSDIANDAANALGNLEES